MPSGSRQIGELLRQRRERLSPADHGTTGTARRRTPGLRREEVAELAGISADWYVRLEQGRGSLPSRQTIDALAKALRLTPADHAHLLSLALGPPRRSLQKGDCPRESRPIGQAPEIADLHHWNPVRYALLESTRGQTVSRLFEDTGKRAQHALSDVHFARDQGPLPGLGVGSTGMLENFRTNFDFWSDAPEFLELVEDLKRLSSEFVDGGRITECASELLARRSYVTRHSERSQPIMRPFKRAKIRA